jgi:hypothetical protein
MNNADFHISLPIPSPRHGASCRLASPSNAFARPLEVIYSAPVTWMAQPLHKAHSSPRQAVSGAGQEPLAGLAQIPNCRFLASPEGKVDAL